MTNKIEEYSIDKNGNPKVIMNKNTARDILIVTYAFEAGERAAAGTYDKAHLGEYIAKNFLADKSAAMYLDVDDKGNSRWRKLRTFEEAVEAEAKKYLENEHFE